MLKRSSVLALGFAAIAASWGSTPGFSAPAPVASNSSLLVPALNALDTLTTVQSPQIYQDNFVCSFARSEGTECTSDTKIFPSSQRLIIEFVSGVCALVTNNSITEAGIFTVVGDQPARHSLSVNAPSLNNHIQ